MKILIRKVSIVLLIFCIIFITNLPIVNAGTASLGEETMKKLKGITDVGTMNPGLTSIGGKIIYIVQYVGYSVAVIILLTIGIKYMVSAPNEKADIKSRLVPYVTGALILFAGISVISLIYTIVTSIE